jgi:tRNA dimethylallyltransferase
MQKLLVIVGPTASGKTALSIKLAQKHHGEIISADSRQVYTGMDLGTGKQRSTLVPIWGYDLAEPTEDFSVSHFQSFADKKIEEIALREKLPVLVGGTGLYIRAVVDGIATANVPQNRLLRQRLDSCSVTELTKELKALAPEKLSKMNDSDRHNPRRLIRAIEIALSSVKPSVVVKKYDPLIIGLTAPLEVLYKRVEKNIGKRIDAGVFDEVTQLLSSGVSWDSPAMTSLGYRQLQSFFTGKKTKEEAILDWIQEEKKYVKRQITWFKQDIRIKWIPIIEADYEKKVEEYIKSWENKRYDTEKS